MGMAKIPTFITLLPSGIQKNIYAATTILGHYLPKERVSTLQQLQEVSGSCGYPASQKSIRLLTVILKYLKSIQVPKL